jgi:AcrR family transcriptional regulator
MQNSIPTPSADVAARIAGQTWAKRGPDYAGEVRRLLDAALSVMRTCGTTARPRVADIVAAAGLSNEAFYRHFQSKDALVAAILEDGTERLVGYLAHQMAKERTPQAQVKCWVEGILSQAGDDDIARTTLAVLWNAGSASKGMTAAPPSPSAPLASLVRGPFEELGSADPDLDATLAAHAVVGQLSDYLWQHVRPTATQTDQIVCFCLAVAGRRDTPPTR